FDFLAVSLNLDNITLLYIEVSSGFLRYPGVVVPGSLTYRLGQFLQPGVIGQCPITDTYFFVYSQFDTTIISLIALGNCLSCRCHVTTEGYGRRTSLRSYFENTVMQ